MSSLKNQREFFEQYADKEDDELIGIYADEGISGKSMKNRGEFLRLLSDSENGLFDYVAVKDISRFARNTSDFLYGIRTLRKNGVDVRFLSGNQTVIGESEFVLTVFAALAQEESANLSKRVIFGKQQNAKKGRVPNCVYGYDKTDTFTLTVNERESAVVRLIFKWYTDGIGSRAVAAKLNEMGIPTKKNAKWISTTVRRILQNPIYTGRLVNNKSVTKDFLSGTRAAVPREEWYTHERPQLRIISDEDFAAVGEKMKDRREIYKNNNRYSAKHIFSNLVKCAVCGGSFTAKTYNGSVRYRCSVHNNHGGKACGNAAAVSEKELLDEIKTCFPDGLCRQRKTEIHAENLGYAKDNLLRRRVKMKELYAAGMIDINELKEEFEKIRQGIHSIEAELKSHRDIEAREYTNADMREVIDKIIVYPDKTLDVILFQSD